MARLRDRMPVILDVATSRVSSEARKPFFFEKKKQKTFTPLSRTWASAADREKKFFRPFFQKRTAFFLRISSQAGRYYCVFGACIMHQGKSADRQGVQPRLKTNRPDILVAVERCQEGGCGTLLAMSPLNRAPPPPSTVKVERSKTEVSILSGMAREVTAFEDVLVKLALNDDPT